MLLPTGTAAVTSILSSTVKHESYSPLNHGKVRGVPRWPNSVLLRSRWSANRPSSACVGRLADWTGDAARRRECSAARSSSRRPRISRIITRPTQSGLSGSLSASLPLSEASPAPVHRRRFVASESGMDGRMGERTGGREGGSLMLQPFQKAADSLARSAGPLIPLPPWPH